MSCGEKNFTIAQGKTFSVVLRWETGPVVFKAITAVANTAPVRITATGHGLPDGWRAAVVSVKGMTQLNAECDPPDPHIDYHRVSVVDANTVDLDGVNAASYKVYTSGGYLQFNTPVDMAGYTARMSIKDRVGGAELFSLTTENSRIAIDNTARTITLTVSATATAAMTWPRGVYELEMVSAGGEVYTLLRGTAKVVQEITT